MTRIPLATDLKTRTGAPDKDARLTNCYVETRGDQSVVRKRAVAHGGVSVGTGVAQGGIAIGMTFPNSSSPATAYDTVIMVKGDSLRLVIKIPVGGKIIWKSAEDISGAWSMFLLSCGAYDVPNDEKFETTQGPFETYPQAPDDSISYVDIAETNCGTYRKKITKTYSVRTVTQTFNAYSVLLPNQTQACKDAGGVGLGLQANGQAFIDTSIAYHNSAVPERAPWTYDPIHTIANGLSNYALFLLDKDLTSYVAGGCSIPETVYYIDETEVWSYEIA